MRAARSARTEFGSVEGYDVVLETRRTSGPTAEPRAVELTDAKVRESGKDAQR